MNSGKRSKEAKADLVKPPVPGNQHLWLVPKGWLIAAFLAPWLAVGLLLIVQRSRDRTPSAEQTGTPSLQSSGSSRSSNPGPWGKLEIAPILIAPPLEFIPPDDDRSAITDIFWHFQDMSADDLAGLLAQSGLDAPRQAAILQSAREDPSIRGFVANPPVALVRGLSPRERERIYEALARCPRNDSQTNAFRFTGASPDDWFEGAPVSQATRDLIRPFIFVHDGLLQFADFDLVREQVWGEERRRLFKALLRETTYLVKLQVPQDSSVDSIADYWGQGGRRLDVRPLIESASEIREAYPVDITHLLPTFARQHLYRYPRITLADLARPAFMNCFWSALNFFNEIPDDRYLDVKVVMQTIQRDYYLIHDNFQLGDLVVFSDAGGNFYHAAVYLADNLLFSKNGTSSLSPWIIVPLERIKGYYPQYAHSGNIKYFRRRL